MDYDDFDDDFFEDEIGEDFDDGLEITEDDIAQDIEKDEHFEEPLESGISFEEFLFWGGFLGINIDEEREERRRKKERNNLDLEDGIKREDDF